MSYPRRLRPPASRSFFLFGPRQTGKSTFARGLLTDRDVVVDLLPQRSYLAYSKEPGRLREELLAHHRRAGHFTCLVDEVQKIPALLDEAHELIESLGIRFILTGSSARKLRRGGVNLLAGRAYTCRLFPLAESELGDDFDLDRALRFGTLPALYSPGREDEPEFLRAYAGTYLKEEVAAEGLVRSIGPFAWFLDIAASCDGETVNMSRIARECAVSVKTVQQYYEILEETFLALRVPGWNRSARRRLVAHPRFYLFDPGVTNALCHTLGENLDPVTRGRRFEQFVAQRISAEIHYAKLDAGIAYWRTNHGAEVDFLLHRGSRILAAIEVRSGRHAARDPLTGLRSFAEEHPQVPRFLLLPEARPRLLDEGVRVLSWNDFLRDVLPGL